MYLMVSLLISSGTLWLLPLAKGTQYNYYAYVGKCDYFYANAQTKLSAEKFFGQGTYYFYFSNYIPETTTCAKVEFTKDRQYEAVTVFNKQTPGGYISWYNNAGYGSGIVHESFQPEGYNEPFIYNLIITNYDEKLGVMSFVRCSDKGKMGVRYGAYSVVIHHETMKNKKLLEKAHYVADTFIKRDSIIGHNIAADCV